MVCQGSTASRFHLNKVTPKSVIKRFLLEIYLTFMENTI